jgi:3-(3-hydroxy-phenyl)propionate hydroxylase
VDNARIILAERGGDDKVSRYGSRRSGGEVMANDIGSNDQMHETNVVIVGGGPVGAMLANLLGLQGISTLVLEREAAIYNLPRAVHFDDEVMRLFQTVGLAEMIEPLVHVSPGMKFVDDTGRLLLDWGRPLEPSEQGWYASYRFHQPELERVLRDGLARWPSVSLKLRTEVFALEQERDAVVVRYEDLSTGALANSGHVMSWVATARVRWCGA